MSGAGRAVRGPLPVLVITTPILAACAFAVALLPSERLDSELTAMLATCAVIGTRVSFDIEGTLFWDGSFLPIVCAAALLGPAPTVAITLVSEASAWYAERYRARVLPVNLVGTLAPNFGAALILSEIGPQLTSGWFYVLLSGVVCASVALNAVLITSLAGILYDAPILDRMRRQGAILAPVAVNVVLAIGAVAVYRAEGLAATAFVLGGVFVFAFVTRRLAADRENREQIRQLANSRGRLVAQLLEAEDRARREMADAIHDDLIQTLMAARQDLAEALAQDSALPDVDTHLDEAIRQARELIRATHPTVLDQVGLAAALSAIADQAAHRGGFAVSLDIEPSMTSRHDRLLFSAARELLANVRKHANATDVVVAVRRIADGIELSVADNGVGLDSLDRAAEVYAGHIGLSSLVERVEGVGGQMELVPSPRGTHVRVRLPEPTSADRPQPPTERQPGLAAPR